MTHTLKHAIFVAFITLSSFFSQGCDKPSLVLNEVKEYPDVNAELWKYFQSFEKASAERGLYVDLIASGITGSLENIDIENVVGLCNYSVTNASKVTIDASFWKRASELRKEMIVFHELGHCFLKLGHIDDAYSDGRCKSIMRSGEGSCVDVYTYDNRKEYQDELFMHH